MGCLFSKSKQLPTVDIEADNNRCFDMNRFKSSCCDNANVSETFVCCSTVDADVLKQINERKTKKQSAKPKSK